MKSTGAFFVASLFLASICNAQDPPAQHAAWTDVYHVHITKAAPGKAGPLADYLKTPDPKAPMPGHFLVLRHQSGEDWDYAVIEHMGTKATVDAAGTPMPPSARDLSIWHGDTFVSGPPWEEFARAMGITGDSAGKTADAVYLVAVYRALPGHRDDLLKVLTTPGASRAERTAGTVILRHLEGAPWQFLEISRYNSWQDFANLEEATEKETRKGTGGWFELRENISYHTDTLTDRIAP
ncbi:MAG TPA: hypothetical protein VM554_07200 [Acidisarcina sp.]|nr:hypothetical protein [Acidisarcina sp.]